MENKSGNNKIIGFVIHIVCMLRRDRIICSKHKYDRSQPQKQEMWLHLAKQNRDKKPQYTTGVEKSVQNIEF